MFHVSSAAGDRSIEFFIFMLMAGDGAILVSCEAVILELKGLYGCYFLCVCTRISLFFMFQLQMLLSLFIVKSS